LCRPWGGVGIHSSTRGYKEILDLTAQMRQKEIIGKSTRGEWYQQYGLKARHRTNHIVGMSTN
jgi:hypothetical protein